MQSIQKLALNLHLIFNSIDTTHKTNYVQEPVNNRSKTSSETSSASQKADGELDQLTQQVNNNVYTSLYGHTRNLRNLLRFD